MATGDRHIINIRCDKPMRRSKERCNTPFFTRWKCTGKCLECFCCITMDNYGDEKHVGIRWKG